MSEEYCVQEFEVICTLYCNDSFPDVKYSRDVLLLPYISCHYLFTEDGSGEPAAKKQRVGETLVITTDADNQEELRRQLEEVQKQAEAYKQQLKVKEEEAEEYKKQLSGMSK